MFLSRSLPTRQRTRTMCRQRHVRSVRVSAVFSPRAKEDDVVVGASPPPPSQDFVRDVGKRAAAATTAAALTLSAFLGPATPLLPATAATTMTTTEQNTATKTSSYRLPVVSPDPDVLSVQRVLLQAWDIVDRAFVDGTFGGRDLGAWRGDLVDSLDAAAGAGAAVGGGLGGARLAEMAIDAMLDRLQDPYTRRMPAGDYEAFRQSSDGEIAGGVGLLIAAQPLATDDDVAAPSAAAPPTTTNEPSPSPSSLTNSTRLRSRLVVLSPIQGSPADRAGIRPGDEVLAIDGRPTDGLGGESAAGMLRGPRGSSVVVDVARREVEEGVDGDESMIPGKAGRPAPRVVSSPSEKKKDDDQSNVRVSIMQVKLRREKVELSPVTSSMLTVDESPTPSEQENKHHVGYVRLASFNARAASDTARALEQLRSRGAEAFVLDLRGNGGGLVRSAVDVSRSLLKKGSTIFAVQGRSDDGDESASTRRLGEMSPVEDAADVVSASSGIPATAITRRVVLDDGGGVEGEGSGGNVVSSLSRGVRSLLPRLVSSLEGQENEQSSPSLLFHPDETTPMAVLVDKNSASASEILAGALRDNGRASLVGERTFGKGKIQSVFPLRDGSALFVTVARYVTPTESQIDGVGIVPQHSCRARSSRQHVLSASSSLPNGTLLGGESEALQASLSSDPCVLTAERLLLAQVEKQQEATGGGGGEQRL